MLGVSCDVGNLPCFDPFHDFHDDIAFRRILPHALTGVVSFPCYVIYINATVPADFENKS